MKRSLPKKQKLISTASTSRGNLSNIPNLKYTVNCYSNNGSNAHKDTLSFTEDKQFKEKESVQIKNELIEKNNTERIVKPGTSGSTGSEFISEFSQKLNDYLIDKDIKIGNLEAYLEFTKQVLEKTKSNLKNERAEKEKIAKQLSELQKTHNNMVQENKRTEALFVKEITSIQQQLTASQDACAKLKTDAINFISNFNPFDKNCSADLNHSKSQPKPRILDSEENFLNFITLGIKKNLSENGIQK